MPDSNEFRMARDSLGEVRVPADALYGPQTQRALDNFPISGTPLPAGFIHALALIKACAARANGALGELDPQRADAIAAAADAVAAGAHDDAFPVDVFQTGSGTSTNMNANEVIATLAARRCGRPVHPNDDVNRGQSSNDVIPSAIHVSAALALRDRLLPAVDHLAVTVETRAAALDTAVKTGRTHLMDALPITFGQELSGWTAQLRAAAKRLAACLPDLANLALGGTAVGTGINAHPQFAARTTALLTAITGMDFRPAPNAFAALAGQDAAVALSGQLRGLAVVLMKIANDLRWMNSGPGAGLGEITLPALQPGSSIMPAKVNPVIPEAVAMVCAQVIGLDTAVTLAGQSGSFQLNTMLPLIAHNLLVSIGLLANASRSLADKAVAGFTVNRDRLAAAAAGNPILVTALAPAIGYDLAAAIAKRAMAEGRPLRDVTLEMSGLDAAEVDRLLDPLHLTQRPE